MCVFATFFQKQNVPRKLDKKTFERHTSTPQGTGRESGRGETVVVW